MSEKTRKYQVWLSMGFAALIILPILSPVIPFSAEIEIIEKRQLAQKPNLTLRKIRSFPEEYEKYFNDHFAFRNLLIRWNSIIKSGYLRMSPVPTKVVIGKEGWLFYVAEGALENYRRTSVFSKDELDRIRQTAERRTQWLKNRGIAYYIVLVPEKQTIYPEFMPDSIQRVGNVSKLDQVTAHLKKNPDLNIIDTRQGLLNEKGKHVLYDNLGTHWNQYGAFIAYRQLMDKVVQGFPEISPLEKEDFSIKTEIVAGGEITAMLALPDSFFEEEIIKLVPKKERTFEFMKGHDATRGQYIMWVTTKNKNPNLPKLLMYRDSFATRLIPYLSENFSHSIYKWDFSFETDLIKQEKPDIVIHQVEERYLEHLKG